MKPNILIAMPVHDAVKPGCVRSLLDLQRRFIQDGIACEFSLLTNSDVSVARNYFGTAMLAGRFTHLLFCDSDMTYEPTAIIRLLRADKPVIGCVCPYRSAKGSFNIRYLTEADGVTVNLTLDDNRCRVAGIGTGIALIRSSVFRDMHATGKLTSYAVHPYLEALSGGPLIGFFDRASVNGELLGEDFSFCHRWRALCGGEVWADVSGDIGHVGDFTYRASLLDHLKTLR